MKVGTEDKKKLRLAIVAGFLGLIALGVIYNELFGGPSAPPPASAPVVVAAPAAVGAAPAASGKGSGAAARKLGTTAAQLDPTLHMEAMLATESLVYRGSGRNIFAAGAEPAAVKAIAVVQPKFPARPNLTPVNQPVVNPGAPPPPPIHLKFFGTATAANGSRRAFLLNGDDVFLASPGEVVERKYRVVSIALNSILVEDIPNNNKQTLPLLGN